MKQKFVPLTLLLLLFASTLFVVGCTDADPYDSYGSYTEYEVSSLTPSLKSFSTVKQYQDVVNVQSDYGYYGGNMLRGVGESGMAVDSALPMMETTASLKSADGIDFSETNNQVIGVDEADLLKTDGEYVYTLTDKTVYVLKAYPAEDAVLLSTIDFEDYNPQNLFLHEDRLIVFGNFDDNDFYDELGFRPQSGMMFVNVYDVSDKENPSLVKELKLEGRYHDGRLVDEHMYLVVRNTPEIRDVYPTPIVVEDGVAKSMPIDSIFYRPMPYNRVELVTTHAISLDDYAINSVAITTESLQTLYMSKENIYLVGQQYISEWEITQEVTKDVLQDQLTSADKLLIEKIKKTDNAVLSQSEKEQKIMAVYYRFVSALPSQEQKDLQERVEAEVVKRLEAFDHLQYTIIDKIATHSGKPKIVAQGKVPGRVSNQFSLDEHDTYLRIATTIDPVWSSFVKERKDSTNNVWMLDSNLKEVGQLTDLAQGERIYSTRFIGDKLYMVTFRQIDPFFVIDLSNPQQPVSLGELKIPGFSRYLHPYDENHIIGIGREASELGRVEGLKISLFDVTDVTNPKEVAKFVTEDDYAQSSAEYEHKAFLFDKKRNLLVIPAYSYNHRSQGETYNGAFVFNISPENIALRGLIDHSSNLGSSYYYRPGVERSFYIQDMLYTKSPSLLRINRLTDLEGVKNIELKGDVSMNVY